MTRRHWLIAISLLSACAPLGISPPVSDERLEIWQAAHQAFAAQEFERATMLFSHLTESYPGSAEARESLFYLGTMRLDPRNPAWDPQPAEELLRRYLASDSTAEAQASRQPEASTLLLLAQQLNLPAEMRMPGLQPEVVERRVVVPARQSRALAAEVERLRVQLAERDAQIKKQEEELERIRKTLAGKRE